MSKARSFSPLPEGLEQLLTDNHIEVDEGQLIISRQFQRSGRGTILVNGTLVPTTVLRRLGAYLLDIHGQFDNSLIFNSSYHVAILDGLTADVRQARQDYDELYRQWHQTEGEIKALRHDESEKARRLSILAFQIKEIEGAALKEGEDDELEQKINKASHAEHIKDNLKEAMFALEGANASPASSNRSRPSTAAWKRRRLTMKLSVPWPAKSRLCPMKSKTSTTAS